MANLKELEKMVSDYCLYIGLPTVSIVDLDFIKKSGNTFGFIPLNLEDIALEPWVSTLDGDADGKYGKNVESFYGPRDYYVRENEGCISFWSEANDIGFLIYKI